MYDSSLVRKTPIRFAICLRIAIALFSVTFFQPDEYFQALEPAHDLVFGYGHLTWEWRTRPPIRSIFFPILFVPVYWVLKVLGLDEGAFLIWAPKVVQGLFASITDVAVRRLARNILGERYVATTFFISITSLFHVQALSRTLSNSLETSLTTFALSYWPFVTFHSSRHLNKPLIVAAVACMIRPTNAIIWFFLIVELSWRLRLHFSRVLLLWGHVCAIGVISCTSLFIIDSWYFETPTFTPLNFFITNLSPVSAFYGRSPWHYYFTQAIPILCNFTSPFVLHGILQVFRNGNLPAQRLVTLILWTIFVYSLSAHKEWRFIHPLLPAMHVIASKPIVDNETRNQKQPPYIRAWRIIIILTGLAATPYLLLVHSSAQIAVVNHLRSISKNELRSVGYLMPCHSTPWQSHLHRPHLTNNTHWALGCEPPIRDQGGGTYKDQSDIFYASPIKYLRTMFPTAVDPQFPPSQFPASIPGAGVIDRSWTHSWPSHLVFFGSLLETDGVRPLLETLGYRQDWYRWNGWEQDGRRRGGVMVWAWQGPKAT